LNPNFQENRMSTLKKILIASATAVALCSPALCSAVTVSGGSTTGLGSFLSRLVSQLPQQQIVTVSGGSSGPGGLVIVVNPSTGNPLAQNVADAALWNLVSSAKSQNSAKPFETLSSGLVTTATPLVFTPSAVPSPVPLPGVTWLFVLGVLGMAGSRLTTPCAASGRPPLASGKAEAFSSVLAFSFGSSSAPLGALMGRHDGAK
jgi:hypothetical protein